MSHDAYSDEAVDTEQLVDALRKGDDAAGAFLVSRHAPLLLGYAAVIAGDLSETDRELLCERSVERAVDRIDQFEPQKGSFPGWLRGILRNEVKSWRRSRPVVGELDEGRVASADVEAPVKESEYVDAPTVVAELLAKLTDTDKLIIRLRDLEDVPYSTIARNLDVREDACRQRHRRALERLREVGASSAARGQEREGGQQ